MPVNERGHLHSDPLVEVVKLAELDKTWEQRIAQERRLREAISRPVPDEDDVP